MAKEAKKMLSVRLHPRVIESLEKLAKQHKVSQSDVIAVLIHCAYMDWWDEEKFNEWMEVARISG